MGTAVMGVGQLRIGARGLNLLEQSCADVAAINAPTNGVVAPGNLAFGADRALTSVTLRPIALQTAAISSSAWNVRTPVENLASSCSKAEAGVIG